MIEFNCKAILFDLDGVLVDSSLCIERHWREWAEKHNLDLQEIMRAAHGRRTEDTIRAIAPHLDAEEEAMQFAESEALDTEGVFGIEGAARLLKPLPGHSWAIVTSGPMRTALARLERAGLPIPAVLVTGEEVKLGKPDPEPYQLAAARLRLAPAECIVVEDAPAGIQAGRAAEMRVIAVASTHSIDELKSAQVVAQRLSDIRVVALPHESPAGLTIRITANGEGQKGPGEEGAFK